MEMTFSEYWKEILYFASLEGICIEQISEENFAYLKSKAKILYKKDVEAYDAFDRLVDLF